MHKSSSVWFVAILITGLSLSGRVAAAETGVESTKVEFQLREGVLQVLIAGRPVAEYVWKDDQVRRPYFRHLRTRSGIQVTRNHPPVKGEDIDDHATMHPGLWLAFGDVASGDVGSVDFWRNKGHVRHVKFLQEPQGGEGSGNFTVLNSYEFEGRVICTETCRMRITTRAGGYVIGWDSTFRSDQAEFAFGDQEEMGLGLRVATPLAVVKAGQILDSEGRKNGAQVWGKQANWCEYGGVLEGQRVGVVLMPGMENFRKSWFHARDYGLLVANPFGENAFTKGTASRVVVAKGADFRLRFDILVYSTRADQQFDVAGAVRDVAKGDQ